MLTIQTTRIAGQSDWATRTCYFVLRFPERDAATLVPTYFIVIVTIPYNSYYATQAQTCIPSLHWLVMFK